MSMETRLLLAFILMGAVMFVTPYFFKQPPKPPANPASNQTTASQTPANPSAQTGDQAPANVKPAPETAPAANAASTAPLPGATKAESVPNLVIETDLFRVVFSNRGANVQSWVLKKYRGNDGKELELTDTTAGTKIDPPLSLSFPAQKPTADVNKVLYEQTPDPDGLGVTYAFSDGHTAVRKTFRFQKNSYLSQVTTEVSVDGKPVPTCSNGAAALAI